MFYTFFYIHKALYKTKIALRSIKKQSNFSIPTETTICQRLHLAFARCFFYECSDLYKTVKVIVFIPNRLSGQLSGQLLGHL